MSLRDMTQKQRAERDSILLDLYKAEAAVDALRTGGVSENHAWMYRMKQEVEKHRQRIRDLNATVRPRDMGGR